MSSAALGEETIFSEAAQAGISTQSSQICQTTPAEKTHYPCRVASSSSRRKVAYVSLLFSVQLMVSWHSRCNGVGQDRSGPLSPRWPSPGQPSVPALRPHLSDQRFGINWQRHSESSLDSIRPPLPFTSPHSLATAYLPTIPPATYLTTAATNQPVPHHFSTWSSFLELPGATSTRGVTKTEASQDMCPNTAHFTDILISLSICTKTTQKSVVGRNSAGHSH
ncbi:unnamed protein product [Pleuronectes platessa]|uniref:Uncharacterized protein n=1 Tax=Pleuronectes platessa TaxID=8262 RepID=A0A9N7TKG6_PLEPL|nr:unnamed protein product [Pleuronectes platessa]